MTRKTAARRIGSVMVGATMLAPAACSFLKHTPKASPEQVAARQAEDVRIRREVESRLAAEPSIASGRVRVAVDSGYVSLFGAVSGLGALRCAERNAELVRGVVHVIDQLVLDPGPRDVRCLSPRVLTTASNP